MHPGQGNGLSEHFLGEVGGEETVTLLQSEIPAHTHNTQVVGGDPAELQGPSPARSIARSGNGFGYVGGTPNVTMAPEVLPVAGSSFGNRPTAVKVNAPTFCVRLPSGPHRDAGKTHQSLASSGS